MAIKIKPLNNFTKTDDYNPNKLVSMPMSFAREMIRQIAYNPRVSSSKKSYTYSLYTKDNIVGWLQNPSSEASEKGLRNASNYMYLSSMHYNRLLNSYARLYTGSYVISPIKNYKDASKETFSKQFFKTAEKLDMINIPQLLAEATLVAMRDGGFYGVLLSDSTTAFIQKLDPDYCKITDICDGVFVYKVDMTKISTKLNQFPAEFTTMYANYLKTGDKWQEVPLEMQFCIKGDSSLVDYTIPSFASVMPSLYTIANADSLQETSEEIKNYKMLAGQIPMDDNGNPLISDDLIDKYYTHVSNALGDNIGLAITPFKFEPFAFNQNNGASEVDNFARCVSNFWSTAGTSSLLHGRENNTSGVTKLAIKNDESYLLGIVQQFQRVMNRYLKIAFTGSVKFKINILPITIFNQDEMISKYKEAASFGLGKSYYAASLGMSQLDVIGLQSLESQIMPFDDLSPLKSTYTLKADNGKDAGRPQSKDLTESGEQTRDDDTNANR